MSRKEIARFITGECSEKEQKRIEVWVKSDPGNKKIIRDYQKAWEISGNLGLEQDEDLAWEKLSQKISQPNHLVSIHQLRKKSQAGKNGIKHVYKGPGSFRKASYHNWLLRIASIFLLAVGVLCTLYFYNSEFSAPVKEAGMQPEMREIIAERGQRVTVTFSDGTSVVLNSSSVIRFPSKFVGDSRQVELQGEAFFSVARKEKMPFLVHTNEAVIQVLGTKFNVNAYPDEEKVEVVVADGKVAVRSAPGGDQVDHDDHRRDNEVILIRGEYTLVEQGGIPSVPEKVVLKNYLGWINGNLIFETTPLEVVIKKLELYYDRDFVVSDSSLFDRRLTASFDKESFSKVLEVLSVALDLEYEQKGSSVFLKSYEQEKNGE